MNQLKRLKIIAFWKHFSKTIFKLQAKQELDIRISAPFSWQLQWIIYRKERFYWCGTNAQGQNLHKFSTFSIPGKPPAPKKDTGVVFEIAVTVISRGNGSLHRATIYYYPLLPASAWYYSCLCQAQPINKSHFLRHTTKKPCTCRDRYCSQETFTWINNSFFRVNYID